MRHKGTQRVSSNAFSLTNPLWAKHFSQMRAYRATSSSPPNTASATLSNQVLRMGPDGGGGDDGSMGTEQINKLANKSLSVR